jgi:two-component sensor histidine kinase
VRGATELHGNEAGRFSVSGPPVSLRPKAVLALGLMLHELSTNALKYGALSAEEGRVEIRWWREEADPQMVRLRWTERGGPPVSPPARKGFGTKLIERGLAGNLGGRVMLSYEPQGLVCEAEMRAEPDGRGTDPERLHERLAKHP